MDSLKMQVLPIITSVAFSLAQHTVEYRTIDLLWLFELQVSEQSNILCHGTASMLASIEIIKRLEALNSGMAKRENQGSPGEGTKPPAGKRWFFW
ncbi:hypothetical protein U9M48_034293 [Paspalum notatum var. saurae]|uniref:Uncharacterized protein n=1 Tax=Paspalum notatum var. saurae TaxID=547442 RepID=A0AAQ3UA90_PASNO